MPIIWKWYFNEWIFPAPPRNIFSVLNECPPLSTEPKLFNTIPTQFLLSHFYPHWFSTEPLLVGQKMTDVLCSTFFSLLWRAQARGEAQYQSCPSSNRASTYLCTDQQITWLSMFDMTVLSTKTRWYCGMCLLILYDYAKLSIISSWWREKVTGEIRKWLLWEMKLIEWPKYSWCSAKVVGAFQKNRRF